MCKRFYFVGCNANGFILTPMAGLSSKNPRLSEVSASPRSEETLHIERN